MPMTMLGRICSYSLRGRTIEARMLRSLAGTRKVAKKKRKLTMSRPK